MTIRTGTMWVLLLTACGDTADSCPRFDGVYLTTYDEISGDCGPLDADLDTYEGGDKPAPPAACTVREREVSEDGCDLTADVECPEDFADGTSGTVRTVGSVHKDGAESAHGTLELRLSDASGGRICRSVYELDVTKR